MNSLVYYMHDECAAFRFVLRGSLSRESARDVEQARATAASVLAGRPLIFDCTAITSIDDDARELLATWEGLGAQIVFQQPRGPASHWLPPRAVALWLAALMSLVSMGAVIWARATILTAARSAQAFPISKTRLVRRMPVPEGTECTSQRSLDRAPVFPSA